VDEREEAQLLQLAIAGDRPAFAALVDRYWERVFHWLHSLTRDPHLAEDLTQEAFLRALRALDTFILGSSFRGWLFRIAQNAWIDQNRVRRPEIQTLSPLLSIRAASPHEEVVEREGRHLLQEACDRLPDTYRAAFLLWSHHDLSFAEIATVVGTTEATARWRVFKARVFLVKQLQSYLDRNLS
jgi:RNA polymerase sigma-70 factor, ECF subfamily